MPCTRTAPERPRLEIADILRAELGDDAERQRLGAEQRAAVRDILRCRTARLGGHLEICSHCGFERPAVQLLPQPPLPEVPGARLGALGRDAHATRAADASLPRRLHTAGRAALSRPPQPGAGVRALVAGRGRNAARPRSRPALARRARPARRHHRVAHLDARASLPSACPLHRLRRRALARPAALGACARRLPVSRPRARRTVPRQAARRPRPREATGATGPARLQRRTTARCAVGSTGCIARAGSSTPSGLSAARSRSIAISAATPIASPSATPG